MRNITKIFTLVLSLILLLAVSCSNDDKTGIKNNPPEDMEITDGETGSGSTSGGSSGTETGGGSGEGEGGTETGGGSEEGDGGTETPPTPSDEITEPLDAKDFPEDLKGYYAHSSKGEPDIIVSDDKGQTHIMAKLIPEDSSDGTPHTIRIKKWTKTTKGGKIIKIECEDNEGGYIITFDYENKTISGSYIVNNEKYSSFSGTKK